MQLLRINLYKIFITIFVAVFPYQLSAGNLVINEVMSNVRGSDSGAGSPGDRNEFIELYNASVDTLDLSLYRVSDLDATDEIISWTDTLLSDTDVIYGTTLLPPGDFAVILDPEYTNTGDGSYLQPYDFPAKTLIVTVGNTTIGDGLSTKDPVVLLDSSDDTISSYGTPIDTTDNIPYDPGDGISAELTSPFLPDNELYWVSSTSSTGSTPGAPNSCASQEDLIIPSSDFTVTPEKVNLGETVSISVAIRNQTTDTIKGVNVDFFVDVNWDSLISTNEVIASLYKTDLIPPLGGTLRVKTEWKPELEGNKRLGVRLKTSEKARAFKMLKVGNPVGDVVLNEIMCKPSGGGEWVEFYNRSSHPVDIYGWKIDVGCEEKEEITKNHTLLKAKEYIVVVEDKTMFETKWGNVPSQIIEPEKWLTLRNDGDTISLVNDCLFNFDKVFYKGGSGAGVSIERINPDAKSNLDWNWGSSCDYSGATPGRRNSIYASSNYEKTVLSVSPNPFSPDGDGYQERAVISYELPFNKAKVNLSLYTRTGVWKYCFLNQKDSGREGTIIWDGRDAKRRRMPIGLYIIYLEAVDKNTDRRVIKKKAVVIAGRK